MATEILLLDDNDVLEPTDFYRYTEISYVGQSDTVHEINTYGGTAINFFRWMRLDREGGCAGWYGKTVGEVKQFSVGTQHQPGPRFEFARGNIPVPHQVPETLFEETQRMGKLVITFGKYNGMSVNEILTVDDGYIRWLYYNTTTFNEFSSSAASAYI